MDGGRGYYTPPARAAAGVPSMSPSRLFRIIGPGLAVAATGVGAGDLATAAFCGGALGIGVLWAVPLGAALKFVLTEGLARWQLVSGETLLEGVLSRAPRPVAWLFLAYLLSWSWFVGSALVSACGVATHALVPVFDDPARAKLVWGALGSLAGLGLAWFGGYRWLERAMGGAVALMTVTVLVTAASLAPTPAELARGLFVPRLPPSDAALGWTVALIGGVGGTLTILCYGYWITERGRTSPRDLAATRIDLAVGYAVTALFGLAMVVIGSTVRVEGGGARLVVELGDRLETTLGPLARLAFLVGAFAAVFSSLLGVWQAVPYLFADSLRILRRRGGPAPAEPVDTAGAAYRGYLLALAVLPLLGLGTSFRAVQKAYAVVGAAFLPLLALALLVCNGRWVTGRHRNRLLTSAALLATLAFFAWAGWLEVRRRLAG